ncbi:hypothetical protein B0H63DRAFT_460788 [Podospora didyma]|uniref:Uncharacterized protein n=1 Tax=Podospora didyma TaxID=330526 RepID=A0AAE0U8H7_9PEZI|nr:hypothetical protein B0H63DRAFT_460788 [Podospora didyma]
MSREMKGRRLGGGASSWWREGFIGGGGITKRRWACIIIFILPVLWFCARVTLTSRKAKREQAGNSSFFISIYMFSKLFTYYLPLLFIHLSDLDGFG